MANDYPTSRGSSSNSAPRPSRSPASSYGAPVYQLPSRPTYPWQSAPFSDTGLSPRRGSVPATYPMPPISAIGRAMLNRRVPELARLTNPWMSAADIAKQLALIQFQEWLAITRSGKPGGDFKLIAECPTAPSGFIAGGRVRVSPNPDPTWTTAAATCQNATGTSPTAMNPLWNDVEYVAPRSGLPIGFNQWKAYYFRPGPQNNPEPPLPLKERDGSVIRRELEDKEDWVRKALRDQMGMLAPGYSPTGQRGSAPIPWYSQPGYNRAINSPLFRFPITWHQAGNRVPEEAPGQAPRDHEYGQPSPLEPPVGDRDAPVEEAPWYPPWWEYPDPGPRPGDNPDIVIDPPPESIDPPWGDPIPPVDPVSIEPPSHRYEPPGPGVREKKLKTRYATAFRFIMNAYTETSDFIAAINKALPKKKQCRAPFGKRPTLQCMLEHIWQNLDDVDWVEAAYNIAENQVEDQIIGRTNRAINSGFGRTVAGQGAATALGHVQNMEGPGYALEPPSYVAGPWSGLDAIMDAAKSRILGKD